MLKQEHQIAIDKSKEFLSKAIQTYFDISESALQKIIDKYEYVAYDKNVKILKETDVPQHTYFICRGIIKVCYLREEKEIIDSFLDEGGFFGSMQNYQSNQPIMQTYETLEKVDLLRIRYSDVLSLLNDSNEVEKVVRKILEANHNKYVQHAQNLKSLSSDKKYDFFVSEFTSHINRIPLKDIANYLGMTPETLSRIRARYDKNKK